MSALCKLSIKFVLTVGLTSLFAASMTAQQDPATGIRDPAMQNMTVILETVSCATLGHLVDIIVGHSDAGLQFSGTFDGNKWQASVTGQYQDKPLALTYSGARTPDGSITGRGVGTVGRLPIEMRIVSSFIEVPGELVQTYDAGGPTDGVLWDMQIIKFYSEFGGVTTDKGVCILSFAGQIKNKWVQFSKWIGGGDFYIVRKLDNPKILITLRSEDTLLSRQAPFTVTGTVTLSSTP